MTFQLETELCSIKHFQGVYEVNSIVNSFYVDDRIAECAIIANNAIFFFPLWIEHFLSKVVFIVCVVFVFQV